MSKTSAKRKLRAEKKAKQAQARPYPGNLTLDLAIMAVILLLAFGVRYVSLADNGVTYDEPIYVLTGLDYVQAWSQLNFSETAWAENMEHPPVSKYVYGIAINLLSHPPLSYGAYMAAKEASALMGAATCILVYLIGRNFFSRKVGVTSALILALTPVFLAHTQIAALESPLALFFTLTAYLFMTALQRDSRNYFVASAVALGLTVGVKFNGILILPLLALIFAIFTLGKAEGKGWKDKLGHIAKKPGDYVPVDQLVYFFAIALVVFYVTWPWIWLNPVGHLGASIGHWTYETREYFLGTLQQAPLYYYPAYFAVTTPLLLFVPLALGIFAAARSKDAFKVSILAWLAVPFLYGFSSFVQDGMRYLIMIYPAMALLCGYGLWQAAEWIGDRLKSAGGKATADRPLTADRVFDADRVFAVASALTVIYLVVSIASVSPYYLDYYNALAGGPKGAYENRSFEFGWWGEGIREAMNYVESTAQPGATVVMLTMPEDATNMETLEGRMSYFYPFPIAVGWRDVALNFSQPMMASYKDQEAKVIPMYYITNIALRREFNITVVDANYTLVHEVTVQGAPLASVYKRTTPVPNLTAST